jgi:hypothetical protein
LDPVLGSAESRRLGISVWTPFGKDGPDEPCESVIVFVKGYDDRVSAG